MNEKQGDVVYTPEWVVKDMLDLAAAWESEAETCAVGTTDPSGTCWAACLRACARDLRRALHEYPDDYDPNPPTPTGEPNE